VCHRSGGTSFTSPTPTNAGARRTVVVLRGGYVRSRLLGEARATSTGSPLLSVGVKEPIAERPPTTRVLAHDRDRASPCCQTHVARQTENEPLATTARGFSTGFPRIALLANVQRLGARWGSVASVV
jgi:hypothetical protein